MNTWKGCSLIADHALSRLESVTVADINAFLERLETAGSIFCTAQGRSGYILRCFCMRLMHMGYRTHFTGDTVTPPIGPGDILVVLSGSGRTSCTYSLLEQARAAGASTFGVLGTRHAPMDGHLDGAIYVSGVEPPVGSSEGKSFDQPLGSPFEQAAFLLLEAVLQELFHQQGSNQVALRQRHTNLE
jgi:6-phospho-3-hexuloisomerase